MMAYISASPFVYQVMLGLRPRCSTESPSRSTPWPHAVSALSARLTASVSSRRLLGVGLSLTLIATLSLLTLVLTGAPAWTIAIPIFVAVSCQGLILGNATALALAARPARIRLRFRRPGRPASGWERRSLHWSVLAESTPPCPWPW